MEHARLWRDTKSGNRLSRQAEILGGEKIVMGGMCVVSENCRLLGNVKMQNECKEAISMGTFCIVEQLCLLEPPQVAVKKKVAVKNKDPEGMMSGTSLHKTLTMGSFVLVGRSSEVRCRRIGRRVIVGSCCILSRGCELGDVVIVEPNVTIPESCKVPHFTLVKQHPEFPNSIQFIPLPGSIKKCIENWCKEAYLGISVDMSKIVTDLQSNGSP
ncbi:LAFA_0D08482g1_1 [Lachancea sp. 'fantastica']|nr:LAFA_0D08482g1_1 [Lachancea sp. 'fantastica']